MSMVSKKSPLIHIFNVALAALYNDDDQLGDGSISHVKFSPTNPDHLLTSSWDTTVRLYEAGDETNSQQKCKFDHRAAVLACCFEDEGHGFSGGLDTAVR
ncbi:hypothetical protein MPER_03106, partial [Moniliophthora perniciosa FA553]